MTYKLYEIGEQLSALESVLENLEGIDIPADLHQEYLDLLNDLKTTKEDFIDKIDSILALIQTRKRWLEIRKLERERLDKLIKKDEKSIDWLQKYLQEHLEKLGIDKLTTNKFNLAIRTAPVEPLVLLESDVTKIPEKYQKVTIEVNKKLLKEDLQKGVDVTKIATLGEKTKYLSIK